jgi:predicted MFS family arabinose efflux permease
MSAPAGAVGALRIRARGRTRRGARVPVTAVFFVLGAISASWAARIPAVKGPLHLSAGTLGLALLGPGIGAIVAMPATGAALARLAPRPVAMAGFLPLCGLLPLVTVAGNAWQLFLVLLGWGAAVGVIDVGMNVEAAAVQERIGRRVMSRFHASYSLGGLAGAALGAACASTGITAQAQLAVASLAVAAIGLAAASRFHGHPFPHQAARRRPPARSRRPVLSWALVALSATAFGSFLAEGAANDWSAVYLHSSLGASSGVAALGYTFFASAMAAGRLCGDHLADRFGPVHLVRTSAGAGAAAFGAALVADRTGAALAGFVILGLSLSFVVPLVLTAASRLGQPGPSLAVATSSGYAGMLIGPAAIGGLADRVSLPAALGVVVAVTALAALLAGALASRPRPAADSSPS